MSQIPQELKYTRSHEWVRQEADGSLTVGITDHAQDSLGDLVFVELPEVGAEMAAEEAAAVVESVKAASDVYAPLAGTVTSINEALGQSPEAVNEDPYGEGWLFRLKPVASEDVEALLDAAGYEEMLQAEEQS